MYNRLSYTQQARAIDLLFFLYVAETGKECDTLNRVDLQERMRRLLETGVSEQPWPEEEGIYTWQLLRWEADTPLDDSQRAQLAAQAEAALAPCGETAAVFAPGAPDDLLLLVGHRRFAASVHRVTAVWLCGHVLIDRCNAAADQEGTLRIGDELASPLDCLARQTQLEEAIVWWARCCPMESSAVHRHRTALQTLLKRRQYSSLGGYVSRALRGEKEPGIACFAFVPVMVEAVWSQTDLSLEELCQGLSLGDMTRRPREALLAWIDQLLPKLKACAPASGAQPIQRVTAAIEADCSLPYSQLNLSRSLGITPAYFCRLFREQTGQHFSSYLMRVRMEKAKALLAAGGLSLQEIGERCSYPNKSYFCQVFRRYTGMTPGEYEAAAKNGGLSQ